MPKIIELDVAAFKTFAISKNQSDEEQIKKFLTQYYQLIHATDGYGISMDQINILDIVFDVIRDIALVYIKKYHASKSTDTEKISALLEQCDDLRGSMFFPAHMILTEDNRECFHSYPTFHCNNMLGVNELQYEYRFHSRQIINRIFYNEH
jgi:hypothetical protein